MSDALILAARVRNYINNREKYSDNHYPSTEEVDYMEGVKPLITKLTGQGYGRINSLSDIMSSEWMTEYNKQMSSRVGGSSKRRSNRRRATKRKNRLIKKRRHSTRRR